MQRIKTKGGRRQKHYASKELASKDSQVNTGNTKNFWSKSIYVLE